MKRTPKAPTKSNDPSWVEKHILRAMTCPKAFKKWLPAHHIAEFTSPNVIRFDKLEKVLESMRGKNWLESKQNKGSYGYWYRISDQGLQIIDY